MENENEKKSWWKSFKSFIKKILPGKKAAVTLGIAASAMGANMDKANASDYIVERIDDKAVTDVANELNVNPVDLKNLTVDASQLEQRIDARSDWEKARDAVQDVQTGVNSVENVFGAINNLGRSSSINSTINNAERVVDNFNKGQDTLSQLLSKPSVKETKSEKVKTENVENEKSDSLIVERTVPEKKVEKTDKVQEMSDVDKVLQNSHFDTVKQNPYDIEDALSSEIVDLNLKLSKARYDGNFELAKQLEEQIELKRAQRIELTNLRREEGITSDRLEHAPESMQRDYTPERVEKLVAFTNLSPNWTTGEKIAVLSSGIVDLKVAIDGCIKNGDIETANKLIKVHNEALKERYALSKMAHEEQGNPEYDLHMPENYDRYGIRNSSSKEQVTTQKTEKEDKDTKYSPSKVEGIDVEDIFGNIDLAAAATTAQVTAPTKQDLDYEKLSNVSMGQMGVLEEDEIVKETPKKEDLDYEKLSNVSAGQMGIWNELEDMLDEDTSSTSTTTDNKKEVVLEEKEKAEEVKQTPQTDSKTVDNYKANAGKISVDDIFKDLNINDFVEKGKNAKSRDDDGEER